MSVATQLKENARQESDAVPTECSLITKVGIGFSHTEKRHIAISKTLSPPVVSLAFELTAKRLSVARRCAHLLLYTTILRGVNTTGRILNLDFVEETKRCHSSRRTQDYGG